MFDICIYDANQMRSPYFSKLITNKSSTATTGNESYTTHPIHIILTSYLVTPAGIFLPLTVIA